MKTALPENAKIAKEAKECMQECVSEFISFITSEGMLLRTCPGGVATSLILIVLQHQRNVSKRNGRRSMEKTSYLP